MKQQKSLMKFLLASLAMAFLLSTHISAAIEWDYKDFNGWEKPGDLIKAGSEELVIEKVRPVDCRVVKGFMINPIDGAVDSGSFNGGRFMEMAYPVPHGFNPAYERQRDPGVHIKLADKKGFNYIYVRGGFIGSLYKGVDVDDGPGKGTKLFDINSPTIDMKVKSGWYYYLLQPPFRFFRQKADVTDADTFSFFWKKRDWTVNGGASTCLSDVGFFRVGEKATKKNYKKTVSFAITDTTEMPQGLAENVLAFGKMDKRFSGKKRLPRFNNEAPQTFLSLKKDGTGKSIKLKAMEFNHLITDPLPAGTPIGAVRFRLDFKGVKPGSKILLIVQDPLNRNQELMRLDFKLKGPGKVNLLYDFPDQIIPYKENAVLFLHGNRKNAELVVQSPPAEVAEFKKLQNPYLAAIEKRKKTKEIKDYPERQKYWKACQKELSDISEKIKKLCGSDTAEKKAPGRPLWITLLSEDGGELSASSKIEIHMPEREEAEKEWKASRMMMLKGYFSMLAESRPWISIWSNFSMTDFMKNHSRGQDYFYRMHQLYETLLELNARYSDDPIISKYYRWVHMKWLPDTPLKKDIPEIEEIPGVPRWAQLLDRAAQKSSAVVKWWIENRRASNGEFGGGLNDDTCLMPWFLNPTLIDSSLQKEVKKSYADVMDIAIKHTLEGGINKQDNDYGHGYEDGANQESYMPVLLYGNPYYLQYNMQAAITLSKIAPMTPGGYRRFIPHIQNKQAGGRPNFGARLLKKGIPADPDWWKKERRNNASGVNFHPVLTMAWFNRNKAALKMLREFGDGTENWRKCGGYDSGPQFGFGMFWMTGEKKYLTRKFYNTNDKNGRIKIEGTGGPFGDYIIHGDYKKSDYWKKAVKNKWNFINFPSEGWPATFDRSYLVKGLEQTLWGLNLKASMGGIETYY
ncbi:MAG: hypothetical protein ACYTFY_16930, partial [Planctomycetota bacterium]